MYSALIVTPDFVSSDTFDNNSKNIEFSGGYTTFDGFNFTGFNGQRRNMSIGGSTGVNDGITGRVVDAFHTGSDQIDQSSFLSFAKKLYQDSKASNSMDYLDQSACIREYSTNFLSGHRNFLIVVKNLTSLPADEVASNGSMLAYLDSRNWNQDLFSDGGVHWNPSAWMCSTVNDSAAIIINEGEMLSQSTSSTRKIFKANGDLDLTCDVQKVLDNASKYNNWTVASQTQDHTYVVDHCLSQIVEEVCEVQFALSLMIIVIVCNAVKLISMVLAIRSFPKPPLVVLGDAIASFLDRPDPATAGICLTIGENAERVHMSVAEGAEMRRAKQRKWTDRRERWSLVKRGTWIISLFL